MADMLDPNAFEAMMTEQRDAEIRRTRESFDRRKADARSAGADRTKGAKSKMENKASVITSVFMCVVIALCLMLMVRSCNATYESQVVHNQFSGETYVRMDIFKGFYMVFILPALTFGAIVVAYHLFTNWYTSINAAALDAEKKAIESGVQADIKRLDAECAQRVGEIERSYAERIDAHTREYEAAQRAMSVSYVDSPVAREIADFLLQPLLDAIRSRDRRPHVETVFVPFSFDVYRFKVVGTYGGTYDFETRRVEFLRSMAEQTALANAIATMIHTEVISAFPVDPSGGEVEPMDISYKYWTDHVEASMSYRAANANYVKARSF